MNTPTPDYGEPWSIQEGHLSTSLFDGEGVYFADIHEFVGEDSSVAWAKAERIIACVNACSKMADPAAEIAAMREAIKEAWIQMQYAESSFAGLALRVCPNDSAVDSVLNRMTEAITKLQPFIK